MRLSPLKSSAWSSIFGVPGRPDALFARLLAIPATTQIGRAAKVRALLVHVMRDEWRGPADEMEWEKEQARALLGEFAGMSEDELAAI